jgi:hypothetical protein
MKGQPRNPGARTLARWSVVGSSTFETANWSAAGASGGEYSKVERLLLSESLLRQGRNAVSQDCPSSLTILSPLAAFAPTAQIPAFWWALLVCIHQRSSPARRSGMAENRLQIFRTAVAELGDVPTDQLVAFIQQKYAVRIEPKYVPFYKATIRDKDSQKPSSPASQPPSETTPGQQATEQSVATTPVSSPETDASKVQSEVQAA